MSAQVWFAQDESGVRPGEHVSLSLAIENLGDRTETFTVIPAGLTASWTTITRPVVTLFGGSRDVVEVVVRPPAIHSTSAGPTTFTVRVVPQGTPDDVAVAETIVLVEAFDDRRITTLQPIQRARRRAVYEFTLENHGNNLASCRLHLIDASNRVDGTFDPPALGVSPGGSSLARLRVRAIGGFIRRAERQIDFQIEATEPDHQPALGRATLIQPPTIPGRAIGRAVALAAALAGLVLAWYGVVRPELRDAADRAVAERLTELETPTTTIATVVATLAPAEDEPAAIIAEPIGEPADYRIDVDVDVGQVRSESIAIPPDSEFRLTDLVLQNPNGDLGTAQLLRNGDELYRWNLGEMTSANEFQPRVSPLPFAPSDNVVLSIECEGAGDPTATGCAIAVLLGGVLVPVDPDAE